jgi:elongation factor P--(R)-beta-lysine ligase
MSRRLQFELIQIIRNYFRQQGFLDVLTPPAVENPGMEVHIHPFQLYSVKAQKPQPLYLHTSPEFCLKELLADTSADFSKIFSISYCFRDEPTSPIHRPQFLMLEWYRRGAHYESIMEDVEGLLSYCLQQGQSLKLPVRAKMLNQIMVKKTMQQIFLEILEIDILEHLELDAIKALLKSFPEVPLPSAELEWDDYFFLLYLNKIEPQLQHIPLLMITEFPAPLSALSTLKTTDSRVCERFEVYVNGIELCNCFNELTDPQEQKRRFTQQQQLKKKLYHYSLPEPKKFYAVMESGLPTSAGIALGVERLLHSMFDVEQPFFY